MRNLAADPAVREGFIGATLCNLLAFALVLAAEWRFPDPDFTGMDPNILRGDPLLSKYLSPPWFHEMNFFLLFPLWQLVYILPMLMRARRQGAYSKARGIALAAGFTLVFWCIPFLIFFGISVLLLGLAVLGHRM